MEGRRETWLVTEPTNFERRLIGSTEGYGNPLPLLVGLLSKGGLGRVVMAARLEASCLDPKGRSQDGEAGETRLLIRNMAKCVITPRGCRCFVRGRPSANTEAWRVRSASAPSFR